MKPLPVPLTSVRPAASRQHSASGMSPDAARSKTPDAVTGKADGRTTEHDLAPQGAAAAPVTRQRPLSIRCEECDGEGGWYHYGAGAYDPDSAIRRWIDCPECDGAGEFDVEGDGDED